MRIYVYTRGYILYTPTYNYMRIYVYIRVYTDTDTESATTHIHAYLSLSPPPIRLYTHKYDTPVDIVDTPIYSSMRIYVYTRVYNRMHKCHLFGPLPTAEVYAYVRVYMRIYAYEIACTGTCS